MPPTRVETKYSNPPLSSWLPPRRDESICEMLAVTWRLLRRSGSVESKYGALYCRPPGTPAVVPRVMNGESNMLVLEPPLFCSCQFFCEYCAVAKVRAPSTPRQVAT